MELTYVPIFVLLLVNLRSGTSAKGSSNDKIICRRNDKKKQVKRQERNLVAF